MSWGGGCRGRLAVIYGGGQPHANTKHENASLQINDHGKKTTMAPHPKQQPYVCQVFRDAMGIVLPWSLWGLLGSGVVEVTMV